MQHQEKIGHCCSVVLYIVLLFIKVVSAEKNAIECYMNIAMNVQCIRKNTQRHLRRSVCFVKDHSTHFEVIALMIVYVSLEVEDMCKVCKMIETTICYNWRDQRKKNTAKALLKFLGSVIKSVDGIDKETLILWRGSGTLPMEFEVDGNWMVDTQKWTQIGGKFSTVERMRFSSRSSELTILLFCCCWFQRMNVILCHMIFSLTVLLSKEMILIHLSESVQVYLFSGVLHI